MRVPNLVTAQSLLHIKSQLTTNAQNILHVYNARVVMSEEGLSHSFQNSRRSCAWYSRHKNALVKCFFIFSWR